MAAHKGPSSRGLALLPVLLLAVMAYHRRWMSDDAFILVRIVRNVLSGHGPVFNIMERVEAYTSPLWLGVLSASAALRLPLEYSAVFLGLVCTLAGLFLGQRAAVHLFRKIESPRVIHLPLGALVFASIPVVWDFATSGLETGLIFFWLGCCFWLLALARDRVTERSSNVEWIVPAIVIGLGPLVRPDLGIFTVVLLAVLLVHNFKLTHRWVNVFVITAVALLLPILYQVFRMGYFSVLVPNTALAKEAGLSNWTQGWHYLRDFMAAYFLWVPLLVLCAWNLWLLRTKQDLGWLIVIGFYAASFLHILFVVRVGGDFMHGRLLLPGTFGLLLPMSSVPIAIKQPRWSWAWSLAGLVVAWSFVCAFFFRVSYGNQVGPHGIADERGFYCRVAKTPNPIRVSDFRRSSFANQGEALRNVLQYLDRHNSPEDPLSRGGVFIDFDDGHRPLRPSDQRLLPKSGRVPESVKLVASRLAIGIQSCMVGSSVHIVDRHGLSDPIASRLRLSVRGRPGHEKDLQNAWLIARFADLDAAPDWPPDVLAAHQVLENPTIVSLLDGIQGPLGFSHFFRNIGASWTLRRLRIDSDPIQALRELNGPSTRTR